MRKTDADSPKTQKGVTLMGKMSEGKKRFVKSSLSEASPTVWIGKGGVSQEVLKEIASQLDKNKMVKGKFLKSALAEGGAKQLAQRIAEQTEASLVEVRGHTFMLYKARKK
ncbi:MAG: YhbY family RNA-binding protein [Candidatus Bathyarchaeia archaeon]